MIPEARLQEIERLRIALNKSAADHLRVKRAIEEGKYGLAASIAYDARYAAVCAALTEESEPADE